jgi:hypothetical protein
MLGPEQTQGSCPRRHSAPCSRSLTWVRTPNAAWLTFPSLSSLAVPELLSHRAVPHRLHTLARQARGFELAPLIARRALARRMFPALQRFTFPAPLSPTFPTSPHPAPVPSARLPHVPVGTSHDVHVDALPNSVRPTRPAAEPERSEGASSCSNNPTAHTAPLIITSEPNAGIADERRCVSWPKPLSSIRRLSSGHVIRCRRRCGRSISVAGARPRRRTRPNAPGDEPQ